MPVDFKQEQRDAMIKAASDACRNCIDKISEPAAAVYAVGFHEQDGELKVIDFDLGSTKLDIAMINIEDGVINEEGHMNIANLGGDNLDEAIVEYCIE